MPDDRSVHGGSVHPSFDSSEPDTLGGLQRVLFEFVRLLPKNAMSRAAGRLAGLPLPGPLQRGQIRLFARIAGVDLSEMRDSIGDFSSLQEFFTRALRDDARPFPEDDAALVSPCDGCWGESGRINRGVLMQVKGREYSVSGILGDSELAGAYEGGTFATFYLSPRDYHRFHTPASGRIVRLDHHPGALWPVNSIGLKGVDELFVKNERVCAFLTPERMPASGSGGGEFADFASDRGEAEPTPIALIAVGATMVGSVRVRFDELRTNEGRLTPSSRRFTTRAPFFARGEEWGYFEFGSTIVMLLPPGDCVLDRREAGTPIRMGEAIGRIG